MLAELINKNKKVVDVGTDHGYLPVFLLENNLAKYVIAADIGEKPLMNAAKTFEKYRVKDNFQLILSDGLDSIPQEFTEEIVLAGMGGTLMRVILERAAWIKSRHIHLILQPMSHAFEVRQFLCENGFYIERETTSSDARFTYLAISAYYDGKENTRDAHYYYFGEIESINTEEAKKLTAKTKKMLESRYEGIKNSSSNIDEKEIIAEILKIQ